MRVLLPIICSGQARRADGSNSPTALKPRTRRSRPPAPRGWPPPRSDPHLNPIRADSSCKDRSNGNSIADFLLAPRPQFQCNPLLGAAAKAVADLVVADHVLAIAGAAADDHVDWGLSLF